MTFSPIRVTDLREALPAGEQAAPGTAGQRDHVTPQDLSGAIGRSAGRADRATVDEVRNGTQQGPTALRVPCARPVDTRRA